MVRAVSLAFGCALILLPARTRAQNATPQRDEAERTVARPLVDVQFDPSFQGEDAWAITRTRPGMAMDAARAREALRAALATGTFAEARAVFVDTSSGRTLIIRGQRRIRLQEVSISFPRGRTRSLENVQTDLALAVGSFSTDADVQSRIDSLARSYRSAGWEQVDIAWRWRMTDSPSSRVLLVTVIEGPPTLVRSVVVLPATLPPDVIAAVRGASRIVPGEPADPAAARRSLEDVLAVVHRARYLEGTVAEPEFRRVSAVRVDAILRVNPGPHYRIEWRGVRALRTRALEEALRLSEESTIDTSTMLVLSTRVRDAYVRRAFLDVRVQASREITSNGNAVLRFEVEERGQVWVRSVIMRGALQVDPAELETILRDLLVAELSESDALQEPGDAVEDALDGGPGFSGSRTRRRLRIDPARTYVPDVYAEAGRRMLQHYRERGFLQANVDAPVVTRGFDRDGARVVDVVFPITEGVVTILDEVLFEGNTAISSRRLADATSIRLGVPVSYAVLDEARTLLTDLYREEGHLFARVETQIDRSPDDSRARVRVQIHEGPRVLVGRIVVRGNRATNRGLILERVALRPGEVYRPSLARRTQQQLDQLGVFSSVTITPVDPEVEAPIKDVSVQVFELPTQYVEARVGFSTGQGFRIGGEYGIRNIAGSAISVNARLQAGLQVFFVDPVFQRNYESLSLLNQIRRQLSISLVHPGLLLPFIRTGPNVRSSIDLGHSRFIERQFAIENNVFALSTTWRPPVRASLLGRPLRQFTLSGALEGQINLLELLGNRDVQSIIAETRPEDRQRIRQLLLIPEGTTTLLIARIESTIDFRDQVFNPQRGFVCSARAEFLFTANFAPSERIESLPNEQRPVSPGNTIGLSPSCTGYVPISIPAVGTIVFASNVRIGFNFGLQPAREGERYQSRTYTNRQFFMGGSDTIRGWLQDTLIPDDVISDLTTDIQACEYANLAQWPFASAVDCAARAGVVQRGGDAMFVWRNELRVPIGSTGLGLAGFLDLGNLWRNPANINPLRMRAAAGVGVRYVTPIGPLAFDFGFNLAPNAQIREVPVAFHFSIGVF